MTLRVEAGAMMGGGALAMTGKAEPMLTSSQVILFYIGNVGVTIGELTTYVGVSVGLLGLLFAVARGLRASAESND